MSDCMVGRVLVGMSGGVDSTATCLLLKKQGYDVVGLTIRNHDIGLADDSDEPLYVAEAREAAKRLGIQHYVADERESFDRDVEKPFADAWLHGRTPNPCVECNPRFKFRILLEWADCLDCPMIATGHYAQITSVGDWYYVEQGIDGLKDQSYFLWKLGQDVLSRTLFPIGGMTKMEVKEFLAENGMEVPPSKGESMEVCFIESDYRSYLHQRLPDIDSRIRHGSFVDCEGRVIGEHKGYPYYTIGQRKGLEVAFGSPRYVLKTNPEKNTVMLGTADQLEADYMLVKDLMIHDCCDNADGLGVRIRYRSRTVLCEILREVESGLWLVHFKESVSAVAPGQSAVFYRGNRVIGGAEIASQRGIRQYLPEV